MACAPEICRAVFDQLRRNAERFDPVLTMYARSQEIIIRVYQTASIRRDEQKIKFQLFSVKAKDFVEKFLAYADRAVGNVLHRQHVYVVRMNDIFQYSLILEIVGEVNESDLLQLSG